VLKLDDGGLDPALFLCVYYVQKVEEERREITSLCMDRVCTLFATELANRDPASKHAPAQNTRFRISPTILNN
jgi:hypothetical protein